MPDLGGIWTSFVTNGVVQLSLRFMLVYIGALYLASVFWTVRDAQQRIENPILPYVAGTLAVVLPLLGLFIYMIVRPRETIHEGYERQLAEESLLAEAERRSVCPTCKERVDEEFLICPACRTRLRRKCPSCARLIKPEWTICPYCAKDFDERDWTVHPGVAARPSVVAQARGRLSIERETSATEQGTAPTER